MVWLQVVLGCISVLVDQYGINLLPNCILKKYRIPNVAHAQMDSNEDDGIEHEDDSNDEEAIETTNKHVSNNKSKSVVWEHFRVNNGKNIVYIVSKQS